MNNHKDDAKEQFFDQLLTYACEKELERMDAEFSTLEGSAVASPSSEFDQKMYKLFRQEEKRARSRRQGFLYQKIAASILIALTVFVVAAASVEAVRTKVLNIIVTITEEYMDINFQDALEDKGTDYNQLPTHPANVFRPSYLPEGFSVTETEINGQYYVIVLTDDNNNSIVIKQTPISAGLSTRMDYEGAIETKVTLDNLDITVLEQQNIMIDGVQYTLYWQQNNCFFTISSVINKDELLRIAASMSGATISE